jgi:hypothetical protein
MSYSDADLIAQIETAIGRWNARAETAYLELAELVGAIQTDFSGLVQNFYQRSDVAPTLAAADSPRADSSREALQASLIKLAHLEDALAGLHIEMQTLHAQARRASGAIDIIAGNVKETLALGTATATTPPSTPSPFEASTPVGSAREAQLAGQVDVLRAELQRVKSELSDTRHQIATHRAAVVPAEAQNEIARLRARVLELMALQDLSVRRKREDLSVQYERILSQAQDQVGRRRRMGEILVSAGVITDVQLDSALREQQSSWNRHLGSVLVDLGYVNEDTVAQTLAAQVGMPYVRLMHERPATEAIALLSKSLAYHHSCVPLRFEKDCLVVAMANPLDLVAIDDLELATRRTIKPVVAAMSEIKTALREHFR